MIEGFLVTTSLNGVIQEIIQDSSEILTHGQSIIPLIEKASTGKFFTFLKLVNDENGAVGWELNMKLKGDIFRTYYLAGIKNSNETLSIIGSNENNETRKYYEDLMKINNEQTNNIRALLKVSNKKDQSSQKQNDSFNEMTKLNNEMANLQRELSKKNFLLENANEKLSKMDIQKTKFLGMAAHDLRNPLSFIQNYSEILLKEDNTMSTNERKEILNDIRKSSLMMLSLVNDFLDVSKIEADELKLNKLPHNLIETIKDSIGSNQIIAAKKGIKLTLVETSGELMMNIDNFKIIQTLNNFISNAIKYSHKQKEVIIVITKKTDSIIVEVKDQGQGIPESELGKVFDAYATTSVKSTAGEKSTGLGLSIVKKIIEGHRGECGVTSEVGKGSNFWFSLPLDELRINKEINSNQVKLSKTTNKEFSFDGQTILIVDDDVLMQKLEAHMFKSYNCEILVASDGSEALEILERENKIDLILIDYFMPILNGPDTVKKIRVDYTKKELPIIGLTGTSEIGHRTEMLNAGMNDVLLKPTKKEELIECLKKIIFNE